MIDQLERACASGAEDERGDEQSAFSAVLSPFGGGGAGDQPYRRWDLRLRLNPVVRDALRALMGGRVGAALEACAGRDAELYELAALVVAPGAAPQPLHADTLWAPSVCLYTAFVALQPVTRPLGPTRFLLGSHVEEATQAAFEAGKQSCTSGRG